MLLNNKNVLDAEQANQHINRLNKLPAVFGFSALFLAVALPGMQAHSQQGVIEEVTVTGSRVIRDGYQAPTPTTVLGAETINAVSPINIADAVNILPSLAGSSTPRTGNAGVSGGQAGTNTLNLRGLGNDRTLVLLDGARVVPQALSGAVDINQFPDTLIERVEIVTGGASAAYGSDAITGVVNFILNRDFTGVKTTMQGGMTDRGENEQYRLSTTVGTPFAEGRGHLIVSGEYGSTEGIERYNRSWYQGWKVINNPDYTPGSGQPSSLVRPNVALSRSAPGALVVSGPLMGTQFIEGGATRQLTYGVVNGLVMEGGDWLETDRSLVQNMEAAVERRNIFGRASYEITDNVEGYVQLSYADSAAESFCCSNFFLGNLTINNENAFLPANIAQQMADAGVSSLAIGTSVADTNDVFQSNDRSVTRYIAGLEGEAQGFGTSWNWNAYAQRGVSTVRNDVDVVDTLLFRRAIDAVRDDSGNIVCRHTLSNPGQACVPYNTLGVGMNSQEAIEYVRGRSWMDQRFQQDVAAAMITGEPFSTPAGEVSVAAGIEYREESITSTVDEGAINNRYFAANQQEVASM